MKRKIELTEADVKAAIKMYVSTRMRLEAKHISFIVQRDTSQFDYETIYGCRVSAEVSE